MGREKKTRKQQEWARAQQVRKDGGNSRFGNGIMVMPKWQPPSAVDWFGPTHKGLDFHGDSKSVVHMFGDYHTWRPDEHDAAFMRIRKSDAYTLPVEYEDA